MVETKVNDGTITSSPGSKSKSNAVISSAWVHEVVSSAARVPRAVSKSARHLRVNAPSPEIWPAESACQMYSNSLPVSEGRLKGIRDGESVAVADGEPFVLAPAVGEVRGVVPSIVFEYSSQMLCA